MTTSKTILIILVLAIIGVGAYSLGKKTTVVPLKPNVVLTDGSSSPLLSNANEQGQCPGITITSPSVGDAVTFPLTITGTIHPTENPGTWIVFEGQAGTVAVQDGSETLSTPAIMTISGEWMNSNQKPFTATIPTLTRTPVGSWGLLMFTDENPSGDGNYHTCSLNVTL